VSYNCDTDSRNSLNIYKYSRNTERESPRDTYVRFINVVRHLRNDLEYIEECIIVRLDRIRRLGAELGQPAETHHCLERHVLVAVDEVSLNEISVLVKLGLEFRLQSYTAYVEYWLMLLIIYISPKRHNEKQSYTESRIG